MAEVIIWSRWGFLTFLAIGAGVLTAFALSTVARLPGGPLIGVMSLALAAVYNLLLVAFVYPRLDRPRQVTFTRPLAQPVRHPNGAVQTAEVVPALDDRGQPLWTTPQSTLFFVPVRFFSVIFLAVAAVVGVVALFRG